MISKAGINAMTTFYLIRHAHAEFSSDEQRPLSRQGQTDAERAAELLGEYPICQIYSSPFQRAIQTIRPLAKKLGLVIHVEPELRERCLGYAPQDIDFTSIVQQTWQDPSFSFPGGESNLAAQRRGMRVFQQLYKRHAGEHLALSTHGNLLCLIIQSFENRINYDFWKALTMPDIYALSIAEEETTITRIWQP
jgi:broad specificity phosphatase PhoE